MYQELVGYIGNTCIRLHWKHMYQATLETHVSGYIGNINYVSGYIGDICIRLQSKHMYQATLETYVSGYNGDICIWST